MRPLLVAFMCWWSSAAQQPKARKMQRLLVDSYSLIVNISSIYFFDGLIEKRITPCLSVLDFLKLLFHKIDSLTWFFTLILLSIVKKPQGTSRNVHQVTPKLKKSMVPIFMSPIWVLRSSAPLTSRWRALKKYYGMFPEKVDGSNVNNWAWITKTSGAK